jgi:YggT family protein
MGGSYLGDAGVFLVDTIFGLYILLVLLRFLFQWVGADFYNPISQFIVTVTNPPLMFIRRFFPGAWGLDLASVVFILALAVLKVYLLAWMGGAQPNFMGVMVFAIGELLQLTVYVFMVAIIIRVILSWIGPRSYHPVVGLLHSLTEPVMGPARRLLPPMGGLDLSPILVFIVLGLALRLIVQPILDIGRALAIA